MPLSPPQARHNSLAEGSAQTLTLTALSTLSAASADDAPAGRVIGMDVNTAASPTAATPATATATIPSPAKLELNSDSREFLIRLERELIATGTNFNPDGSCKSPGPQLSDDADPLKSFDAANASAAGAVQQRASRDKDSAELMKLLHIDESELGKASG